METIFKRRSIRKFREGTIPEAAVTNLLKAAMRAPSAGNQQPWEFIVVRNKQRMLEMMEFHPYAKMLAESDCVIIVCGNKSLQKYPYDFWIQDCSAATQNMLLEATHLGIGAVWLGVYPIEERVIGVQKLFDLPSDVIPLCAVALGYPAVEPKAMDTFRQERIHQEKWSK